MSCMAIDVHNTFHDATTGLLGRLWHGHWCYTCYLYPFVCGLVRTRPLPAALRQRMVSAAELFYLRHCCTCAVDARGQHTTSSSSIASCSVCGRCWRRRHSRFGRSSSSSNSDHRFTVLVRQVRLYCALPYFQLSQAIRSVSKRTL